ncbi:hypothetical protein VaNZ11_015454 [Volvox africanus]|uniref:BRO1 domain-containing protein n=1 Tax=Volvox africanus TaxID=51714 RepID=A0ABQ5SM29_9CHLO|nr:hypothetical protein VaNZ11_015454 [Volvox africanus]
MSTMHRNCSLTLNWYEPLRLLRTKPYDYSLLSKQGLGPLSTVTLACPNFLNELTFRRGAIGMWLQSLNNGCSPDGAPAPDVALEGLSSLAARLEGLFRAIAAAAGASGTDSTVKPAAAAAGCITATAALTMGFMHSEWNSALSRKPQRYLRLDCLPQELAMVYSAYGAALRHSALQHYSQGLLLGAVDTAGGAVSSGGDESGGGDQQSAAAAAGLQAALTRAVAGLRRAAGVYGYLADEVLPALREVMAAAAAAAASRDWPLELLPAAALCMKHLSLAEAQALVAAMAELKGMSPGTQRALHAGCVLLFRDAAVAAQELAAAAPLGLPLSDRLLVRFLPAATALHAARSQLCFAREQQAVMEMGQAEAACEEGLRLLVSAAGCLDKRLDPALWLELIQAEQATCSALHSAVHRDRLAITFQPLPKQPPDALANPAIRVVPDVFQPEVVFPPAPPASAGNKGGCAIM